MARRETLRELEARTLREQGDLPPPLDMTYREPTQAPLLYDPRETPITARQMSNIRANPKSPFTRMKTLMPNILDSLAIQNAHRYANIRKRSGYKWRTVQEL